MKNTVIHFITIIFITSAVTLVMLSVFAYVMLKKDISNDTVDVYVKVVYFLSTFIMGWLTGKKTLNKRFLWGLGMGTMYFIAILLITMFADKSIAMDKAVVAWAICGAGGMLGGMIS